MKEWAARRHGCTCQACGCELPHAAGATDDTTMVAAFEQDPPLRWHSLTTHPWPPKSKKKPATCSKTAAAAAVPAAASPASCCRLSHLALSLSDANSRTPGLVNTTCHSCRSLYPSTSFRARVLATSDFADKLSSSGCFAQMSLMALGGTPTTDARAMVLSLTEELDIDSTRGCQRTTCVDRQGKAMGAADITGDRAVETGMCVEGVSSAVQGSFSSQVRLKVTFRVLSETGVLLVCRLSPCAVPFYAVTRYLAFHFPFITERSMLAHLRAVPWRLDQDAFKAWRQGLTGYPLVDAGGWGCRVGTDVCWGCGW